MTSCFFSNVYFIFVFKKCLSYFLKMNFLFTFYFQFCEAQCEVQEEEVQEEEVDSAFHQPIVEVQRV